MVVLKILKPLTTYGQDHPRLKVHFHQSFARSTGQAASGDGRLGYRPEWMEVPRSSTTGQQPTGWSSASSNIGRGSVAYRTARAVAFFVIQEEGEKYINSIITLHAEVLPVVNAIVDDLRTIGLASGTLQLVWTLSSSSSLSSSLASSSSSKSACLCTSSGSCASHVVPLVATSECATLWGFGEEKFRNALTRFCSHHDEKEKTRRSGSNDAKGR